jgi:hypothetical protein
MRWNMKMLGLACVGAAAVTIWGGAAGAAPAPEPVEGPVCNAGGPYQGECSNNAVTIQLDGSGSYDPRGKPLTFLWFIECGAGYLDDPTSPTPILTFPMNGLCSGACGRVDLFVTAGGVTTKCTTMVTLADSTPPVITCPPDVEVSVGEPTDPSYTGFATATDTCNRNTVVTWADASSALTKGNNTTIVRTWTADDGCNQSSCVQIITVSTAEGPHIDIKPGSCPNPFNIQADAGAVIPVSILGNDLDVSDVDPATVTIAKVQNDGTTGPGVPPVKSAFGDTGTPFGGGNCGCHALTGDGVIDLDLKFDRDAMIAVLELSNEPTGAVIELEVSGLLYDGTPFAARDCIVIK